MGYTIGVFAAMTLLCAGLQSTVLAPLAIHGVQPDLLLALAVSTGLIWGSPRGMAVGFAAGLLEGAFAAKWMAAFVVSKTISGFLAGRFAGIVFRENLLAPVAGTFLVSVANELIFWIATRAAGGGEATLLILGRSLYTAAVAPVFYVALRRLERRLPAAPPA